MKRTQKYNIFFLIITRDNKLWFRFCTPEESPGTDLQNMGNMQAGRSDLINVTCPTLTQTSSPHAFSSTNLNEQTDLTDKNIVMDLENVYENILSTTDIMNEQISADIKNDEEITSMNTTDCDVSHSIELDEDGYETHDSEAESETQLEYTDNDLDEVLLESENEVENSTDNLESELNIEPKLSEKEELCNDEIPETTFITTLGEDHYLPMSPRKMSTIEPAHKTILDNISDFDQSAPQTYEDNHYVEMNVGTDDDDSMQTYELVCVNNGRVEPVYMELNHVVPVKNDEDTIKSQCLSDTTSNFADTKEQTLKRLSKGDKITRDKLDSSDVEEENSSKLSLDAPFCRFSISDTFRPASYYLSGSRTILDRQDSSDSDILPPTPIPNSSPAFDNLLDEELSRYILDKLDKSDISQDNSIIKMLTSENQKMNRAKRKTTSLMIYGSRTSIHDTLTRGEKVRNSRASLTNELNKTIGSSNSLLNNSNVEQHDASIIETDSLRSYNADKGSSRLSIESDVSSKFDMTPSNISSEIQSLMDSDLMINFRNPYAFHNSEDIKRRPLSDDSLFELTETENCIESDVIPSVNLDKYIQCLQAGTSDLSLNSDSANRNNNNNNNTNCLNENNLLLDHVHSTIQHTRSSSTPVSNVLHHSDSDKKSLGARHKFSNTHGYDLADSQSSFSSTGIPQSPTSFYSKNCNENTLIRKNLNSDVMVDKIKEFSNEKLAHRSDNETASSSITTGFHSRDSSTEHSAPYYYSDLSSQEHINVLPTSLYLKNSNSHRKLNNERRRRPMLKNNEIIHIRNPIRNNHGSITNQPFDLVASARSVSVEFLSVVEKNPDIDSKNIYVSSSSNASKIPESMTLMASLGCKKSLKKKNIDLETLVDGNINNHNIMNSSIPVSSESMSSHCSGNSSNTVYYDAEAEANAYENVLYQGEKHWDEDNIWRDNLRRVSHRHARSMDDLDTMPIDNLPNGSYVNTSVMNSIKRIKKCPDKIKRIANYVNCDVQSLVQRRNMEKNNCNSEYNDENDVYVSLVKDSELPIEPIEEGVYEQLAIDPKKNLLVSSVKTKRQFEIDRENLRQWDLMSSGLMKGKIGSVRSTVASKGISDIIHNTNNETESTSNEGIL